MICVVDKSITTVNTAVPAAVGPRFADAQVTIHRKGEPRPVVPGGIWLTLVDGQVTQRI
jgi:hypothetical protein